MARETPARDELQRIPGVGPSLSRALRDLGVRRIDELKGRDPETLYESLCALRGTKVDRCVLYVFRCAVYFASRSRHDPERLKWWNWTDDRMVPRRKNVARRDVQRARMPDRRRQEVTRWAATEIRSR